MQNESNECEKGPRVVNRYKDKFDVYIGRGKGGQIPEIPEYGCWGNPIIIGESCTRCRTLHIHNGATLPCYEDYLRERLRDKRFTDEFLKLKDKVLGCFCKPKPCHGDIIIKVLAEYD